MPYDCRMYALALCISAGFKSHQVEESHIMRELQTRKAGSNSGPTFPKVRLHRGTKKGTIRVSVPKHLIIGSQFASIGH